MELTDALFKEILVTPGHITSEAFVSAKEQAERKNISLKKELIQSDLITDTHMGHAIADYFEVHFIDLSNIQLDPELLVLIPEPVARSQRTVAYEMTEDVLKIATEKIDNYELHKLLEKKTHRRVEVSYTTMQMLDDVLKYYRGDLHEQVTTLIEKCMSNRGDADIVALLDLLLEYAHDANASDLHIEPLESEVLVRFRIDGMLHETVRYPKTLHEQIVFRVKIMARLQTDEHGAAQDGRFSHRTADDVFDVRVSSIPVTDGENIVMRLLSTDTQHFTLENLGLSDSNYKKLVRASMRPHGMLLAVGPTGSGKTTVLYTIVERLNKPAVNIMTIEDPVEYNVEGIQQTQVNAKKQLTFSNGLRSIVRQDPDIVMVGEIRDEETADIAVNAALTGHLLLSTLHTNDAATTFPRLTEMGIEPFLVASSVNVIVATRLVRMICTHCRESYTPTEREHELMQLYPEIEDALMKITESDSVDDIRIYKGAGCAVCNDSGYVGRTGIFEVLEVTDEIRSLIIETASSDVINKRAHELGMHSLLYDGMIKVLDGTTSLEEIVKSALS